MRGRIGYEAYKTSTGGKTYDGRDMPTWEQVCEKTPKVAMAWEAAAEAELPLGSFGWALEHLKRGERVARKGWNGRGMFLFRSTVVPIPAICMKTAQEEIMIGWNPNHLDLFANDWIVV